jgi:hypothetical protein
LGELIAIVGGLESMGSNNFGDSNGVDVFLGRKSEVLFLGIIGRTNEWGIGLRVVNKFSGIEIVSPMSICLGCSSGFVLAMAFQFVTAPVYHFAMCENVSSVQRTLWI